MTHQALVAMELGPSLSPGCPLIKVASPVLSVPFHPAVPTSEPLHNLAAAPETVYNMTATTEPPTSINAKPEPSAIMDAMSVFPVCSPAHDLLQNLLIPQRRSRYPVVSYLPWWDHRSGSQVSCLAYCDHRGCSWVSCLPLWNHRGHSWSACLPEHDHRVNDHIFIPGHVIYIFKQRKKAFGGWTCGIVIFLQY